MALIYIPQQQPISGLGKFKFKAVKKALKSAIDPRQVAKNIKLSVTNPKAFLKQQVKLTRAVHDEITPEAVKKLEAKAKKALPKILPIIAVIASVVAVFFPIIAPAIPYLRAAGVAAAAYQKKQDMDSAKKAQKDFEDQKANMVQSLVNEGLTTDQATRIVDLIVAGAEPQDAMRTVLGEQVQMTVPEDSALLTAPGTQRVGAPSGGGDVSIMPVNTQAPALVADPGLRLTVTPAPASAPTNSIQTSAPVGGNTMTIPADQAQAQFMRWLQSFNPQLFTALVREHPELLQSQQSAPQLVSGIEVDSFTSDFDYMTPDRRYSSLNGLGDFDMSWVDSVASSVGKLANTYFDAQAVKLQLERARQSLAPAPTTQVTKAAAQQTAAAGQPVPAGARFGITPTMMIVGGLGVVGLGAAIFFALRRRGRGRR